MDIIAALHWLQENIGAFGGDPLRTTLAGHGTGSACVHFLITSSAVPEGMYIFYIVFYVCTYKCRWDKYTRKKKKDCLCTSELFCS